MRRQAAFVLALAATTMVACEAREDETIDTQPGEDIAPAPAPAPQPMDMVVATGQFQPTGEAGAMQVMGTAELRRAGTDRSDGLELVVQLSGLDDQEHAWHIHEGACDNVGRIVVPLSGGGALDGIDDDLEADSDGNVNRTVEIDEEHLAVLSSNQSYSVNVHQGSGDNPGAPVACATLDIPNNLWGPGVQGDVPPADATGY
jgi:Cu/Zn superoxide dismutase